MKLWLKNAVLTLLIGGIALGLWRLSGNGHDLSNFVTALWNVTYTIWDAIAKLFVNAFHTFFGSGATPTPAATN